MNDHAQSALEKQNIKKVTQKSKVRNGAQP